MFSSVLNLRGSLISSFFAYRDVTGGTSNGLIDYQSASGNTVLTKLNRLYGMDRLPRPAERSAGGPIHSRRNEAAYNKAWRLSGRPFRQRIRAHGCPLRRQFSPPQKHCPGRQTNAL